MRKIILVLVFVMLMTVSVYGDEYYDFVKITCAKEVEFLEIQSTGMSNIGNFVKKDFSLHMDNLKSLERRYGLYLAWPGNTIKQKCVLKGSTVRIEIKRDESRAQGQCSANPLSYISLWIDAEKIINSVKFGDIACFPPYIKKITLKDNAGALSLSLLIEGAEAYIMEYYIASWKLRQMDKPISNYYIDDIIQKNTEKIEKSIKDNIKKQGGQ